jgi:hypothetical protein
MSHIKNVADATKIICKNFRYGTTPRSNAGQYTGGQTYLFRTSRNVVSTTVRRAKMRIHTLVALKLE